MILSLALAASAFATPATAQQQAVRICTGEVETRDAQTYKALIEGVLARRAEIAQKGAAADALAFLDTRIADLRKHAAAGCTLQA